MAFVFGAVDRKKIDTGSWFESDGQKFLVARHDNARYQGAIESLKRPHARAFQRNEVSAGVLEDIICRAMSQALLLGWEGVSDAAGKPVPYTQEAGFQMLRDSPNFRELIAGFAREEEAFFVS